MIINLKLGGVEIPIESLTDITENISPLSAETVLRMSDGTGVKQTAWSNKYIIDISGSGYTPLVLNGLDYAASMTLECTTPLSVHGALNIVTLPSARRSDVDVVCFAVVNGRAVRTGKSISVNTCTIDTVSGAVGYFANYWPTFTVFASRPKESQGRGGRSWSIRCETL